MNGFDLAGFRSGFARATARLRAESARAPSLAHSRAARNLIYRTVVGLAIVTAGSIADLLSTRLGAFRSWRGTPAFWREAKASCRIDFPPARILLQVSRAVPRPAAFGRSVRAGHRDARRPRLGVGRRGGVLRLSVPDGLSIALRARLSWPWRTGGASGRGGASCAGRGPGALGWIGCRRCAAGKAEPWLQDFDVGAIYDAGMVGAQIAATQEALGEDYAGLLLWNAGNECIAEASRQGNGGTSRGAVNAQRRIRFAASRST